jgi:hypothetical protein
VANIEDLLAMMWDDDLCPADECGALSRSRTVRAVDPASSTEQPRRQPGLLLDVQRSRVCCEYILAPLGNQRKPKPARRNIRTIEFPVKRAIGNNREEYRICNR